MEIEKPNSITLSERDAIHKKLMESILKGLSDTPLVLKGGTALYLGYGLNRFSEDLDFDSSKKLNLINKIKSSVPNEIVVDSVNVKKDTDTVSRYMVNYHHRSSDVESTLKIEISYRTPVPEEQVVVKNGIRFSPVQRIIDNKLTAAFDGENTRTKGRDLFDLHYLARNYPANFDAGLAKRLYEFASNPDKLVNLYQDNVESDPLLNKIMDVEKIAIELNDMAYQMHRVKLAEIKESVQKAPIQKPSFRFKP